MKRLLILASLAVLTMSSSAYAAQNCLGGIECMPQQAQQACTESQEFGCIDWENGVIYALGMGVENPKYKTVAQKRYSAIRAAQVVAQRNLLQMVQEINITSTTQVKDGMLENEEIRTLITGKLRQSQTVGKPKLQREQDGSMTAWVTVKMHMRDIMPGLLGQVPFATKKYQSAPAKTLDKTKAAEETKAVKKDPASIIYTGMLIDARGTDVSPAMSPKVYDEQGKEVYGSAYVDRKFAVEQGIAGYAKKPENAVENDRIKGKVLKVKAIKTTSKDSADLVISDKDAELIRKVGTSQAFLREARVMIILD